MEAAAKLHLLYPDIKWRPQPCICIFRFLYLYFPDLDIKWHGLTRIIWYICIFRRLIIYLGLDICICIPDPDPDIRETLLNTRATDITPPSEYRLSELLPDGHQQNWPIHSFPCLENAKKVPTKIVHSKKSRKTNL